MGLVGRLVGLPWRFLEHLVASRLALPRPPSLPPAAWRVEPERSSGDRPPARFVEVEAAAVVPEPRENDEGDEELSLEEAISRAQHHLVEGAEYLAAILEVWEDLSEEQRAVLRDCLRYFAEVYDFLGRS